MVLSILEEQLHTLQSKIANLQARMMMYEQLFQQAQNLHGQSSDAQNLSNGDQLMNPQQKNPVEQ